MAKKKEKEQVRVEGGVRIPTTSTLRKYGISADEWVEILKNQNYVCAICKKPPKTGRMVTDHEHQMGWKKKKPEIRKRAIRGLTCWWCNATYLGRGITVEKAKNVAEYLESYDRRKASYG